MLRSGVDHRNARWTSADIKANQKEISDCEEESAECDWAALDDFFKKVFQLDPAENENKFLVETVNNLQARLQELEFKYESVV